MHSEAADTTDWMATARLVPWFALDACFGAPDHVPGWLLAEGTVTSPTVESLALPCRGSFVTASAVIGHEAVLVEHYRRILQAAPPASERRQDTVSFSSFDVDLTIGLSGEHALHIDMFSGAAHAAADMLAHLADPVAPPGVLYDNLGQGWALRIVATATEIFTLEWDWDRPAAADTPRALRFMRHAVASQAAAGLHRLRHVHATLVHALGSDLWNVPPR